MLIVVNTSDTIVYIKEKRAGETPNAAYFLEKWRVPSGRGEFSPALKCRVIGKKWDKSRRDE
jgi:hypothetical protein